MKPILFILTALLLTLSSCAEVKPPQSHYYLLTPPQIRQAELASAPLTVRVELAQFLNQGTLVVQLDEQQIRPSHYHRWAEPLPGLIERYIQRRLQQQLTQPSAANLISVMIDRFHGSSQGQVWLSGQWWINSETSHRPRTFSYRATQQQTGYDELVVTLQQLLDNACLDMIGQLTSEVPQ
ncbi:MAG: membrane integrity-associated transporter subunit PqiC [Desulfuromonas sp.]|nr:membrane integrity-associated transporter subunit PqiC [Desulfuromonas sp.]